MHCVVFSDAVLEAYACPRGCLKTESIDASASCQLAQYFVGLPQPQKNCLGLDITVSVSPWCVFALARPDSGSPSSDTDTNSILVTYFHVHSFQFIIAFYQQSTYFPWFFVWNFSSCLASAFSWPSMASPWAISCLALPRPVSLLPRSYLASHLSCLCTPCLAKSPYCLGLASVWEKMPGLHHWWFFSTCWHLTGRHQFGCHI